LWFLDRLAPGLPAYNLPGGLALRGPLDRAAFAASLAEVVRRHAALRTTFMALPALPGRPVQRVAPPPAGEWEVPLIDLAGLPVPARGAEGTRLAREEAVRPFDLARGPLLRVALLREGGTAHQALFTLHHIAADGWSIGILLRELGELYGAFRAGLP